MISEGSCDTKDWSNDADENSALHHRNKLQFEVYQNRKPVLEIAIILHNITVLYIYIYIYIYVHFYIL